EAEMQSADRRVATHEPRDLAHRLVEIESLHLAATLLEKATEPADHVARPLVVLDDVVEDLPHHVEVRRIGAENALAGLGIAQDRGQGLVELMGERSRELSD